MYLVFCLHVCLCSMCVPGTREAREGHEILGFQEVVSLHMGTGKQTQVLSNRQS